MRRDWTDFFRHLIVNVDIPFASIWKSNGSFLFRTRTGNSSLKSVFSTAELTSTRVNSKNRLFVLLRREKLSFRRFEVNENKVEFNQIDQFPVKMMSRVENFTLEHCFCRISIRKVRARGERETKETKDVRLFFRKVEPVDRSRRSDLLIWIWPVWQDVETSRKRVFSMDINRRTPILPMLIFRFDWN